MAGPATLKHHGSEGRMAPAACSWSCLTSLSEATRNELQNDCPGFHNGPPRHIEAPWQWRTDGACGLQPPVLNVAFWTHKKFAQPPKPTCHTETPWLWRADGDCSLQPPVLNVAFCKKLAQPQNRPATLKHHSCEWRMAPAACSRPCLTLLSESTTSLPSLQNGPATLKHHGCEGRMAPAALLSDPQEINPKMTAQASKTDPQLIVPNVAVSSDQKLAPKLLPRLPKRTPCHTETPWQWRTDGACGLQLVVPNVTCWRRKKLVPKWLPRLPKWNLSPRRNTMAVKDGWRLRPAAGHA